MAPSFIVQRIAPRRATSPQHMLAGLVLGRAEAILGFVDRHPRIAFESGIEPVALEMRILVREGTLSRMSRGLGNSGQADFEILDRASRLQSEAARRLAAYEAEMEGAPGREIGRVVEVALSAISTLASVAVILI